MPIYLRIAYQNISGPLPVELTLFPSLPVIDLSFNRFTGTLPSEFATSGMAETLNSLDFHVNQLTGSIPYVYWTHIPNLIYLNLGYNS